MTCVVAEVCIKCKCMDCVEVCPVDCFYVGEAMFVIQALFMDRLQRSPRRRLGRAVGAS